MTPSRQAPRRRSTRGSLHRPDHHVRRNFAPRGWALCDGQLLPISGYSALFSILGTTYGGDGVSTFGLPDFRSRGPMHAGTGPGLSHTSLGQKQGGAMAASGDAVATVPTQTVNFIIALEGSYPSRS